MAAPQQPAAAADEGIDIIKFFLGVMSLLTVFVALFAAYNWSKARRLAEEVEQDQLDLVSIQSMAKKPDFLELVSRDHLYSGVRDITSQDFGNFLLERAGQMNLKLSNFRSVGRGSEQLERKGYVKQGYQFSIDDPPQPLKVIVLYLYWLQGSWPGLKIESLALERARPKRRGETAEGWEATVTASIFRFDESER